MENTIQVAGTLFTLAGDALTYALAGWSRGKLESIEVDWVGNETVKAIYKATSQEEFDMTKPASAPTPTYKFFRGRIVWTGVLFFLGALVATEISGGQIGFHGFSMFGGWFLGIGFERNRSADALACSRDESE